MKNLYENVKKSELKSIASLTRTMAAIETEQKADAVKAAKEKCTVDSNFAVICAFIEQFGQITGVLCPSIGKLQV